MTVLGKISSTLKGLLAISLVLFFSKQLLSQNNNQAKFNERLSSVITGRPQDFKTINDAFEEFKTDSVLIKRLVAASEDVNYPEGESYGLNALGAIYRNISLYERAIKFHTQAEDLAIKAKNDELLVNSLNSTGVSYRRMDDIKPALDYHTKALELAVNTEPRSDILKYNIAVSQNSMGNIYLVLKQYQLAIDHFSKSLAIEKEMGNRLGLAINYQNIGHAYESMGQLDVALANYRRSLDYNEQINSEIGKIICYNSIGQIFIKQGKASEAKTIIENALKKALVMGDKFYTSLSYINLGWAQKELGQFDISEKNLQTALEMSQKYNLKLSEVSASEHLSELFQQKGEFDKAFLNYKNSVKVEETINNERNLKYVNDVIVQFENESKNRQIRSLAAEYEAVSERLRNNKMIFWSSLLGLLILSLILYAISTNRRLSQEKKILTLEQDMLRIQMNPHFIFNSLNSIKLYIINNEKENAVYYLNKFSKFIRKILVSTSEKTISLEDELETMQLYMNIENIRFSNEIDFKINILDNINTMAIKVPPLILQPFLENSIWHGLSTKEKDKIVRIDIFKKSDNFVTIAISDNGIGRKKSEQFKKDSVLERKSLGLSITNARLTNFYSTSNNDFQLEIEDLVDQEDNGVGTKVVLSIPIRSNVLRTA
ncbi:Tetratricopeptide repeat-containing protein [Flavobacteriaceae bacterium MAR_2010_188]|nr:Tetratricopeptide repeat-containing protein [Flavobacteriaceae bacterium MAR_2010_188]